jgi:hypothetical protein
MRNAKFKREVLTATGAAAMLMLSQSAHATTVVATIIGAYDATCNSHCTGIMPAGVSHYATNGGSSADTPSLFILNPTSHSFTSTTLTLTGYQDAANGGTGATEQNPGPGPAQTQTLTLPNIAPHTVYQLIWNGTGSIPGGSTGTPSPGASICSRMTTMTSWATSPVAGIRTVSGTNAAAAAAPSPGYARLSAISTPSLPRP